MATTGLDLRGKSKGDLLQMKHQLELDLNSMRNQIGRAQAEARKTGKHASAEWWVKVHQARRLKGQQCQQIQQELSKLRHANRKSVEGHFLDVVRERMGDDPNFKAYLETAKRRAL